MTQQPRADTPTPHALASEGGGQVQAHHFAATGAPHGTVVIGPAMGVPQA